MKTTTRVQGARREYTCHGYRCANVIRRGERYAYCVAFPGYEFHSGDKGPDSMRLCRRCAGESGIKVAG